MNNKKMLNSILAAITLCIVAASTIFAQESAVKMYVVNASDGYVNMRTGAGTNYDVSQEFPNRSIVVSSSVEQVINGWIPIIFHDGHRLGYIHESGLRLIEEPYVSKLKDFYQEPHRRYSQLYMLSLNIPNLFLSYDNECEYIVEDLKNDRTIFSTGVPFCPNVIWSDTLSFQLYYANHSSGLGTRLNPMLIIYKLYEKDGEYGFYTDIYPEPRRVSREEAEQLVKNIRNVIAKDLDGNAQMVSFHPDFFEFCRQLFLAYCSGVDAWEIIDNSHTDGGLVHEKDIWRSMREAYDSSKLKLDK